MKAGISNIWLLGMIAVFIFLFSCYVIISVNYTRSFKMKNEVLTLIEEGKGIVGLGQTSTSSWAFGQSASSKIVSGATVHKNPASFQHINIYLLGNAYTATGYCPSETGQNCWYGVTSLDKFTYEAADSKKKYYYCFAKFNLPGNQVKADNPLNRYYYRVRLFYKLELPVLQDWLSVKVDGKTNAITNVQDNGTIGNVCA